HAVIERHANDYAIRGLAVSEGTFVNDERIESATLHDGDRIRIGSYELSFHLRGVRGAQPSRAAGFAPIPPMTGPGPGPYPMDDRGQRYPIQSGATTSIGRALDNAIVLAHSSVSRHHASIESQNGGYHLRDLGSQNGTYVGGARVNDSELHDGDAVRIGE